MSNQYCPECGLLAKNNRCSCGWEKGGGSGAERRCCECGGEWNIGVPVPISSKPDETAFRPSANGDGWCWDCWDKRKRQ